MASRVIFLTFAIEELAKSPVPKGVTPSATRTLLNILTNLVSCLMNCRFELKDDVTHKFDNHDNVNTLNARDDVDGINTKDNDNTVGYVKSYKNLVKTNDDTTNVNYIINDDKDLNAMKHKPVRRGRNGKNYGKSSKCINFAFNNVRGCKSKKYEIEKLCYEHNLNIFGLAETFFEDDRVISMKGYKWIGKNLVKGSKDGGGGVGFLVREDVTIIDDNYGNSKSDDFERLWIKVSFNDKYFYCAVSYFPVEGTNINLTEELHNQILPEVIQINDVEEEANIIILGDFNGKIGHHITNGEPKTNNNGRRLLNFTEDSGLTILNFRLYSCIRISS